MNKPLDYILQDLMPEINCNFKIYQGGPVEQDNLYFIHKIPDLIPESIEVSNGIYWGGNFETLRLLLIDKLIEDNDIRFFLGYSGWNKTQLDNEIKDDAWFIANNDFSNILSESNTSLWKNKLLQKGGNYQLWANAPKDVNLN